MKITIELDENLPDDEIRIHCRRMTEELQKIQEAFASGHTETKRLVLYQGDLECYVDVLDILFFETEGTIVQVHTRDEIYETKQRLYELRFFQINFCVFPNRQLQMWRKFIRCKRVTCRQRAVRHFEIPISRFLYPDIIAEY